MTLCGVGGASHSLPPGFRAVEWQLPAPLASCSLLPPSSVETYDMHIYTYDIYITYNHIHIYVYMWDKGPLKPHLLPPSPYPSPHPSPVPRLQCSRVAAGCPLMLHAHGSLLFLRAFSVSPSPCIPGFAAVEWQLVLGVECSASPVDDSLLPPPLHARL